MSDQSKKPEGTDPTTEVMVTAQAQLVDGLAGLFDSGNYSDLTVKCGDQQWKVHRAVLCPRSTWFNNACKDGFQESISHVIELKEDDPALVREVLTACYTCTYDDTVSGDDKLAFNACMYAMADKYDIPFLKDLSKGKLQTQLDRPMDIPRFLKAVRTIYTTTLSSDRGLRDLLVPVLKEHWSALSKDPGFLDLIRSGLVDGDVVADAIAVMSQLLVPKPELGYFCGNCDSSALCGSRNIYCDDCEGYMGEAYQP